MKVLLIDDQREAAHIKSMYGIDVTEVARTYDEGVTALQKGGWDVLLLDHDLNSYPNGVEKTGTDIMQFLQQNPQLLPHTITFVTMNPGGRERMRAILGDIQKGQELTKKKDQP